MNRDLPPVSAILQAWEAGLLSAKLTGEIDAWIETGILPTGEPGTGEDLTRWLLNLDWVPGYIEVKEV